MFLRLPSPVSRLPSPVFRLPSSVFRQAFRALLITLELSVDLRTKL